MTALHKDFYLEQGADWPGEAFAIVDAVDNPKILSSPMVASGAIAGPDGTAIFHWSNTPTDASVGLVVFQAQFYIPQVTAAQTLSWTFTNAPYQLYLFDPAAPVADREIWVAEGTVYLARQIR